MAVVGYSESGASTSNVAHTSIAAVVEAVGCVEMAFATVIVLVTGDVIDADISEGRRGAEVRKRGIEIAAPTSGPSMIFAGFAGLASTTVRLLLGHLRYQLADGGIQLKLLSESRQSGP
ncbi:hypothetical protein PQX77_002596 [Marasmius sp. AFHP31]|nr:hypothetical protein PQX77_002596 [Marasmius sp. AFHP31]